MTRLHRLFKLLSPFIGVHITLHADTSFRPVGRRRAGCPHASLSAEIQWSVARVCCTFTTVCYVGRRVVIVVVKNAQMSVRRQSGRRRTRFGRRPTRARTTNKMHCHCLTAVQVYQCRPSHAMSFLSTPSFHSAKSQYCQAALTNPQKAVVMSQSFQEN